MESEGFYTFFIFLFIFINLFVITACTGAQHLSLF